jgi:hypothetical protein
VDPKQVPPAGPKPSDAPTLARRLGLFDITMLVMGSVIGAGIFVVPHDVAEVVHTPALILIAWVVGGVVSLAGCLVYADLSRRHAQVGGQYAFLRDARTIPSLVFCTAGASSGSFSPAGWRRSPLCSRATSWNLDISSQPITPRC